MTDKDRTIVLKMLRYCRQVEETHRQFREDSSLFFSEEEGFIYRNAVAMPILQIGERAKNLSDGFRSTNDAIPWRAIMGMRDIFAHHYGSVDYSELWHTSHEDVEALKSYLEQNR